MMHPLRRDFKIIEKESDMFWIVGITLALVSFKLGMLTVMVKLLGAALQLVFLALAVVAVYYFWRKIFGRKSDSVAGNEQARIRTNIEL